MEVTMKFIRTKSDDADQRDSFVIDVDPEASVFEAMTRVREEQDGSLAFRGACNTGFCGDCTCQANGKRVVPCLLKVKDSVKDDAIEIKLIRNVAPVKDVLYDIDQFMWKKYKYFRPWLETNGEAPKVTDEELEPVRLAMRCTVCGLCDEGCTVIDVDKEFLGPMALTKGLYRTTMDPRDNDTKQRFIEAGEKRGLWDCVHCWEASEHCPWGINPTHLIMELRDHSVALGVKSGKGNPMAARHYDAFADSVKKSGWLNERMLAQKTYGLPPYGMSVSAMMKQMPIALKAIRNGKASLRPHKSRPGARQIAKMFEKVEQSHRDGKKA